MIHKKAETKDKQHSFTSIGKAALRIEGIQKVSGQALYTADNLLPGTIWGKVLRCPYPHARIARIDRPRQLENRARDKPRVAKVPLP